MLVNFALFPAYCCEDQGIKLPYMKELVTVNSEEYQERSDRCSMSRMNDWFVCGRDGTTCYADQDDDIIFEDFARLRLKGETEA